MSLEIDNAICDECGTCISVCPVDALELTNELRVDIAKCIVCKNCVKVCPVGALRA
jgi:ferredoxin